MGALKFRVVVDTEKEEDIFRDILISGDLTFENFFHAIMSAFDFEGDQLASFYLSNDMWDKGREIGLMDMGFEGEEDNEDFPLVMGKTSIAQLCKEEGQKIILVYDFLSMWCFLIEVIEISEMIWQIYSMMKQKKIIMTKKILAASKILMISTFKCKSPVILMF
jgi:hypothetical protein